MSELPSTFSTLAADGPQNTNTFDGVSNDEICDRTGFKVPRGTLRKEWSGAMVRPQSYDRRHPQELVRARAEHPKGSPRPEQPDSFIMDDEPVEVEDLG
jgi:hypothetical protein